jgi:putative transposase
MEDARAWQTRPLDDVYPVVFLDALVLKIRDGGSVQRRACYLALAIGIDGERDVLGLWFQANEGAKFWMQVLTDLKQRGVQDILIACVDGLKGFPRSDRSRVPSDHDPDLHRSSDPSLVEVRAATPIRRRGQGPQADLHRDRR